MFERFKLFALVISTTVAVCGAIGTMAVTLGEVPRHAARLMGIPDVIERLDQIETTLAPSRRTRPIVVFSQDPAVYSARISDGFLRMRLSLRQYAADGHGCGPARLFALILVDADKVRHTLAIEPPIIAKTSSWSSITVQSGLPSGVNPGGSAQAVIGDYGSCARIDVERSPWISVDT